jgi:hypothetical protein
MGLFLCGMCDLPQGKPCGFLAPQLQLAYLDSVNHL